MRRFKAGDTVRVKCTNHGILSGKVGQVVNVGMMQMGPFPLPLPAVLTDLSPTHPFLPTCLEPYDPPSGQSFEDLMRTVNKKPENAHE